MTDEQSKKLELVMNLKGFRFAGYKTATVVKQFRCILYYNDAYMHAIIAGSEKAAKHKMIEWYSVVFTQQ